MRWGSSLADKRFRRKRPSRRTARVASMSDKPFPVPAGTTAIPVPRGDFETARKVPPGWGIWGGRIVVPPTRRRARPIAASRPAKERPADPAAPRHAWQALLSLDVAEESRRALANVTFTSDERLPSFGIAYPGCPPRATSGSTWDIISGCPCRARRSSSHRPAGGQRRRRQFICGRRHPAAHRDRGRDVGRLRRRAGAAARLATSRRGPATASNLALSVAKWEGRAGIPGKPFRDLGPRLELDRRPGRRLRADPGDSPALSPRPADRLQAALRVGHALGLRAPAGSSSSWPPSSPT